MPRLALSYKQLNPFMLAKLPERNYREIRINSEQIDELFEAAHKIDKTFHQVVAIFLLTGMRRAELFSLEWNEVNFDSGFIYLSRHKTKGRKPRAIPISTKLNEILLTIKNSSELNDKLVMGKYTVNILPKHWNRLLKVISFPLINDGTKLRIHDLRHVYSQSLLNSGVSLEDIQSLLGHQSVETTQKRYA